MISIAVIEKGQPTIDQREQFKQYASVPDDSRDALLTKCLTNAMLAVQAAADIAVLPCQLRLIVDDVLPGEGFILHQGGARVTSATTEVGTLAPADFYFDGWRFECLVAAKRLTINYSNEVIPADADRLMPVVWQYATALYDGETPANLQKILNQLHF